jgi:tetratricopeptide (TPR) repeat protein
MRKSYLKTSIRRPSARLRCCASLSIVVLLCFCQATGAANPRAADPAKLSSLQQKIDELDRAGKYREAIPLAEERLKLVEATAGSNGLELAASCHKLGNLYCANGDYAKARTVLERGLKIREEALGPEHPDTAKSLNDLGLLYVSSGDFAKAQPLFERALKIDEKTLGPIHPDTAECLNNLGLLYDNTGDFTKAKPLSERALKIDEDALGPDHPGTALCLATLAGIYADMGDYTKAESLFQRTLKIREKALGPEHPDTAQSLSNLALLYYMIHDQIRSEPLNQRALQIREKILGPQHPKTAESLGNLAALYDALGDYSKAESFYERTLKIYEKNPGPDHPDTVLAVNNLGLLYWEIGDYAKAEPLYQRALKTDEKVLGPEHPTTAILLNNLALLYQDMGDFAKAEPLFKRALEINEKVLGPDHADTAVKLNNLANNYSYLGDYAKAEPLLERAQRIHEKIFGPESPRTAAGLNNLAKNYVWMGDYAKAEPLLERALKICEKTLGPYHPGTENRLENLASLCIDEGKLTEATEFAQRAARAQQNELANILSFTSEQQRLAFEKINDPYRLFATLGRAPDLAEVVLRCKGIVLDSLLEDRIAAEASQDPKERELIAETRKSKQQLMQALMEVPPDISKEALIRGEAEKQVLSKRVEELEAELARHFEGLGKARRALGVTVVQVQTALGKDNELIELLRYKHYLGKNRSEPRYGAIVIGSQGEPKWVPLGRADRIDDKIKLYQRSVRGKTDERTLSAALHALHDQVWAPIEKMLPTGTSTVIISPDGELNFISFATLLSSDDKFVGEKYSIRYVASGRDLLREMKSTADVQTTMSLFANPDFGKTAELQQVDQKNAVALRSIEMHDLSSISLPQLPGTEKESATLETRANKSGWQSRVYVGSKATETELRQVNSPRVLHLATHGFFLPEIDPGKSDDSSQREKEIPKGKLVNPMHRSGLALAGAQTTLQAWGRGEVPPTENDGIVTAEEVGGLKLSKTWLVVLSACDTGGGEAKAGEGVMGLRRGFVQAGTQNLLMTLWPISDETTVQIMLDFYDRAFKSSNAPQALADTQRDWLVKLRKEHGLLAAVRLAGPFIMSSQGKQ